MTTTTLHDQVLAVMRRAHPRPLTSAVVGWHLEREGRAADSRMLGRVLRGLWLDGRVRRVYTPAGVSVAYALAAVCPACGRRVGPGGTCPSCGEAA